MRSDAFAASDDLMAIIERFSVVVPLRHVPVGQRLIKVMLWLPKCAHLRIGSPVPQPNTLFHLRSAKGTNTFRTVKLQWFKESHKEVTSQIRVPWFNERNMIELLTRPFSQYRGIIET